MEHAMTCTPSFVEGEEGAVLVDFDIESSQGRQAGIANFERTENYYLDENGNPHHHLEEMDMASAEQLEDDFIPELQENDFISGITPEDEAYLRETIGGDEVYFEMIEWARDNLPEEIIDSYNRLLEEGAVDEIEGVIRAMHNHYKLNS